MFSSLQQCRKYQFPQDPGIQSISVGIIPGSKDGESGGSDSAGLALSPVRAAIFPFELISRVREFGLSTVQGCVSA